MAAARGAAMKSISIMWAEGVTESEAATVVETVKQLVKTIYDVCLKAGVGLSPTAIRPFGTWVIPSIPEGDPYSGTHWYVDTAYDRGRQQVVGTRFLELVKQEPWQLANPHFDVAVLDRDLAERSDEAGFVLASVLPGTATVISVHRLREIADEAERLAALRRLAVHNFGHVLEIPREGRTSVVQAGAVRHCTNACVMSEAEQIDDLARAASDDSDAGLCPECRQDLLRSVMIQRLSRN